MANKKAEPSPWLSGKPYYCKLCGCGFAEFMACEMPDCELESEEAAKARASRRNDGR